MSIQINNVNTGTSSVYMVTHKKLTKGNVSASCSYSRCFWDNAPDTFRGKITWSENGKLLWRDEIKSDRLNIDDAVHDAIKEAECQFERSAI